MAEPEGLREAAIQWLKERTLDGQVPLTRDEIADFRWESEPFRLIAPQQGIWKPRAFPATLSIVTTYRRPGQQRPYEDEVGADGLVRYKWRGDDRNHPDNVGLRTAMMQSLPLIWFVGVGMSPARYQAVAPVVLLGEEEEKQQFVLSPVESEDVDEGLMEESPMESSLRRYLYRETKVRLHQPVFRSTVLVAYDNRCAVCNFAHPELLDAAHIVPDHHELGLPTVTNGLSLCKIHHAAFDSKFLGIRPEAGRPIVEIRQDLLDEVDGPMLRHGLQELHGQPLMKLPETRANRPGKEQLAWAYERFLSATVTDVA